MSTLIKPIHSPLRVLILQHPQEPKEPLSSASILAQTLASLGTQPVTIKTGLSWPNLKKALGDQDVIPSRWVVFYLGSHAPSKQGPRPQAAINWIKPPQALHRDDIDGLVLIDGTWKQAKTLWWRNAWLLKLKRAALSPAGPSLYGLHRKEPRPECLSTFESAVLALKLMEDPKWLPENFEAKALEQFRAFVDSKAWLTRRNLSS